MKVRDGSSEVLARLELDGDGRNDIRRLIASAGILCSDEPSGGDLLDEPVLVVRESRRLRSSCLGGVYDSQLELLAQVIPAKERQEWEVVGTAGVVLMRFRRWSSWRRAQDAWCISSPNRSEFASLDPMAERAPAAGRKYVRFALTRHGERIGSVRRRQIWFVLGRVDSVEDALGREVRLGFSPRNPRSAVAQLSDTSTSPLRAAILGVMLDALTVGGN
jgi:hypothetical protein